MKPSPSWPDSWPRCMGPYPKCGHSYCTAHPEYQAMCRKETSPMTKKYMLCPIAAIDLIDDFATAKEKAIKLSDDAQGTLAGGYAVFEVTEVGRAERVSAIWSDPADPFSTGRY